MAVRSSRPRKQKTSWYSPRTKSFYDYGYVKSTSARSAAIRFDSMKPDNTSDSMKIDFYIAQYVNGNRVQIQKAHNV
jgi:hypothetical protein